MAEERDDREHLQADDSQAARTPLARHEDALSPARVVREHSGADAEGASQRIGNTGAQGPTVSFPGTHGQASGDGVDPDAERAPATDGGRDER
jgi:hypothetical protein